MGCASSKLDDLPAVALCRDRCAFLDEAIRHRYALSQSHAAYSHSLLCFGASLHHFMDQDFFSVSLASAPSSPDLTLPPQRKQLDPGPHAESSPKKPHHLPNHSSSNSGSGHLHFHSDDDSDLDEDDDDDDGSHLHLSDHSSPLHIPGGDAPAAAHMQYLNSDYLNGNRNNQDLFPGGGIFHVNYMKNKAATSSIVYEQRPVTNETVHFGESSSTFPPYYYSANHNDDNNPYAYGYQNYGYAGGGGMLGYNKAQSPPQAAASSSKPPPPPPSPPRASAWDFLNPFESYEKYYPQYTPSRDSKELREEEGIPDLEDEEYQHEVVKEVLHRDQKFSGSKPDAGPMDNEEDTRGKMGGGGEAEASLYQTRPTVSMEDDSRVEYEVHVVDKKIVDEERPESRNNARGGGFKDVSQVAVEIKVQFERASQSASEIAKLLEVGKLPYQRKNAATKMLQGPFSVVSSQPSSSNSGEASSSTDTAGPAFLEIDDELALRSKNLSSTLQKLYLWEKKLYQEVKAEEKMRVVHERKYRKLQRLDERGAEPHKVDATRAFIRSLSTKIRMAIQVVDKISVTINKIRDEELWPQLNELIQGLTRMWKGMLECHHNQCQAIRQVRGLGPTGSTKKLSDEHLNATLHLERELLGWTSSFSSWVRAQKGYVRALNNWLVKCLLYEPEETADGIAPFSPGRIGAPPVFVICNQWAQAMDRISEKEVIDAMRVFAMSVLHMWEQDKQQMQQRMMTNKDLERKVRNLDREDQKIQKEIQALDKKIVLVSGEGNSLSLTGNVVYQSDTSNSSLQSSLQRIFDAMERFAADSLKVCEELIQRSEEERLA